ncbi:MAG TPA: cupin domain-containing protein [Chloroflexota bacterium]|nr:cupin domain-containing protein [Chloroflexota bacterium]
MEIETEPRITGPTTSWAGAVAQFTRGFAYDRWLDTVGLPVHRGFFVEDLRTVPVAPWEERECGAAFIQLSGQEGVSEARVCEVPPGATLPPLKMGVDEAVYVAAGVGLATVWADEGGPKTTFEWQPRSLFFIPRNYTCQLSNARGHQPARLLHYNYLPLAMSMIQEVDHFINNPHGRAPASPTDGEMYAEARAVELKNAADTRRKFWYGNFFPDMQAWDKLESLRSRGAGGQSVLMGFPHSEMSAHMSVFPSRTYKKAHRHGPGRVIVIPGGEGFSVMWVEGEEQVLVPWHEASMFVPPDRWFHQHFNVGAEPARYLALHPMRQFIGHGEQVEDLARDQIEYTAEAPWIRQHFEEELAKRGITSLMPPDVYVDPEYEWKAPGGGD